MDEHMNSITMSYPDYQALPRNIRKLLVASESFFFREARSQGGKPARVGSPAKPSAKPRQEFDFAA
jgi:hypothetical protein